VVTVAATATNGSAGKEARRAAPRSSHGDWGPAADRPDPVATLADECTARVPELIPIRNARMAVSPFTFYRGGAGLMASDLADTPTSGIKVQLCGDAHLVNFGGFASPERNLLFDLNDFDETLPGPWEWDVKRLVASVVVAARDRGFDARRQRKLARGTVSAYRRSMRRFAQSRPLDVWYSQLDAAQIGAALRGQEARRYERNLAKARAKDSTRAFARFAYHKNGGIRIAADPPLIIPVEDVAAGSDLGDIEAFMTELVGRYRASLPPDRRPLLDRYRYVHAARKVVGVGSVGTRCWVLLFLGRDDDDPLFLQAKEAETSVLAPHAGSSAFSNQGHRVVAGQRLMQAASDIFLGWIRTEGIDGRERDFYIRQLWDWKASVDVARITPRAFALYTDLCAWTLARAHARSGDAPAIAAYLGSGEVFDLAVARFAELYADQSERDYEAFVAAIADGRLPAASDALTG
jgi:uncharacterized protein (DUF2252 family)